MTSLQSNVLRRAVLVHLNQCGNYKLPEDVLISHLISVLDFPVKTDDIQTALEWLRAKAYVDFTVEPLSEEKRWAITPNGKKAIEN